MHHYYASMDDLLADAFERAAGDDLRAVRAGQVMHHQPRSVRPDALAVEAAELMETHRINSLLVIDAQGQLCGALSSNDLMRAKVI